jgi:hypothetical protein
VLKNSLRKFELVGSEKIRPRQSLSVGLKGLNGELGKIEYVFHGLRKDGAVIDVELHGSAATFGKIGVRRPAPEAGSDTSKPGVHPLEHTHAARFPPPHPRSLQRSILTKVSTGATRHRVALGAS